MLKKKKWKLQYKTINKFHHNLRHVSFSTDYFSPQIRNCGKLPPTFQTAGAPRAWEKETVLYLSNRALLPFRYNSNGARYEQAQNKWGPKRHVKKLPALFLKSRVSSLRLFSIFLFIFTSPQNNIKIKNRKKVNTIFFSTLSFTLEGAD